MKERKYRVWYHGKMIVKSLNDILVDPSNNFMFLDGEVTEWTGLTDKNGMEIYEGDIIQWKWGVTPGYPGPKPEVVRWHEALCGFEPFCFYDSDCDGVPEVSDHDGYEIIGNIFANPGLLSARVK